MIFEKYENVAEAELHAERLEKDGWEVMLIGNLLIYGWCLNE